MGLGRLGAVFLAARNIAAWLSSSKRGRACRHRRDGGRHPPKIPDPRGREGCWPMTLFIADFFGVLAFLAPTKRYFSVENHVGRATPVLSRGVITRLAG